VVGSGLAFRADPTGFLRKCVEKYGPVFSLQLGGLRQVVLLGPEYPKLFFKATDDVLSLNDALKAVSFNLFIDDTSFDYPIHVDLLKQKFTPNMKIWTSLVTQVIDPSYIEALLNDQGTPYSKDSKKGTMITDIERFVFQLLGRSSARCICGSEVYDIPELINTFINFDKDGVKLVGLSVLLPRFLHSFLAGRTKAHHKVMMKYLLPVVQKRRASQDTEQVDFLSYLLESNDADGAPLKDEVIVSRLVLVIFASLTTTGRTLMHTLLDIFSRPEIKQKVLEEQNKVLGDSETVEHEHVKQMEYLEACIRESLRGTANLIGPRRLAMEDIQVGQYTIPKGTIVSLSAYLTGQDKELWGDDADKYRPERFLSETQPLYAYLPFGSGHHACPGRFFAIHEIKTIISLLVRSYDIEVPGGRPDIVWVVNRASTKKEPVIFIKKQPQQKLQHA
jgi:cytochrome P450